MRRRLGNGESGNFLIMMLLIMTLVFILGVVVVDVGMWLSERRGARTDADASVLAGAQELFNQDFINTAANDPTAIENAVSETALRWADLNGLPPEQIYPLLENETKFSANTNCFGPSPVIDTVYLAAEHESRPFFASIFGVGSPEVGARARACLGSISTAEGLMPIGLQTDGPRAGCWEDVDGDGQQDPLFGQDCVITFGASQGSTGEHGSLRLFDDGSQKCSSQSTGGNKTYTDQVKAGGANTECHVYKYFHDPTKTCADDPGGCVYSQPGVGSNPQLQALEDLIAKEGECDTLYGNGDGIDQLLEVVEAVNGDTTPSPDTLFTNLDCESPRLVSLIIVEQLGSSPHKIVAFAAFYIKQCEVDNNQGFQVSEKCRKSDFSGSIGQIGVRGHFLDMRVTTGSVGHISKWSPKRVILVE